MLENKKDDKLRKKMEYMFDFFVALDIIEQKGENGELIFKLKDFEALTNTDLSSDEKLNSYLEQKPFEKIDEEHKAFLNKYKKIEKR